MKRIQPLRPRWVVAGVIIAAALVWSVSLYSIASQIGRPFPGFFYSPDRIVSAFTLQDFTGWQAGLRPWDRIVAVNGQHWREMRRWVQEAGIGGTLVYTVERGDQRLQIAVPTMEFTSDILLRFIPGWLLFAVLSLAIGIFVYVCNPAGREPAPDRSGTGRALPGWRAVVRHLDLGGETLWRPL